MITVAIMCSVVFATLSTALWKCFVMAVSWLSTDVGVERGSKVRPVVEVTPAANTHG